MYLACLRGRGVAPSAVAAHERGGGFPSLAVCGIEALRAQVIPHRCRNRHRSRVDDRPLEPRADFHAEVVARRFPLVRYVENDEAAVPHRIAWLAARTDFPRASEIQRGLLDRAPAERRQ